MIVLNVNFLTPIEISPKYYMLLCCLKVINHIKKSD